MSVEFEKVVLKKLDELNLKVNELSEDMHETKEIVSNHTKLINNLNEEIYDTQDILKIQSQNLAQFEHECILKLNALFDSHSANSESHAVFSKFIAQLNAESFDHKQRISKLEDSFNGTKFLATN